MDIIDFRGAIRQELIEARESRKKRYGYLPDCIRCPETCKVAMAEGLIMFYCHKSNVIDIGENNE